MDLRPLAILLLAVAALLRSEIFFYLLYVLVGIQAMAWLWTRQVARGLTWTRETPAAAFPGEPVEVRVAVRNASLLPIPWLLVQEGVPAGLSSPPTVRHVISLAPREQRVLTFTLEGRRRGLYRIGPLRMRTGDVFGMRELPLESSRTDPLVIYPQVLPLADLGLPAALPFGVEAAPRSLFADPARPLGVRDYRSGDSIRQVDWKSSARVGSLQVRRYEPAIARETLLALAFSRAEYPGRYSYDALERAIIAAASIAAHLIGRRQPVGLCSSGHDPLAGAPASLIAPAGGRAHLIELLRLLGRLEPAPDGDIAAEIGQVAAGLSWGTTVVVLAAGVGQPLIERLLPLRHRGLSVALVLIEGAEADIALARRHGLAVYLVDRAGAPEHA